MKSVAGGSKLARPGTGCLAGSCTNGFASKMSTMSAAALGTMKNKEARVDAPHLPPDTSPLMVRPLGLSLTLVWSPTPASMRCWLRTHFWASCRSLAFQSQRSGPRTFSQIFLANAPAACVVLDFARSKRSWKKRGSAQQASDKLGANRCMQSFGNWLPALAASSNGILSRIRRSWCVGSTFTSSVDTSSSSSLFTTRSTSAVSSVPTPLRATKWSAVKP
mmetsp:Transcript_9821/g.28138  ORF Transcript_9821/g.28138 Transcript_9821/m.28138 type:complete len:220 (-) Transcript_9821:75-734(-)